MVIGGAGTRRVADFYNERKGSKFQNLKFAYDTWPDSFARYGAVMVMDDDVLIDSRGINRLFRIRSGHDLWVLQPAFDPRGKVSWDITRVDPRCRLRFTNFVEMTCPLFRQDKLAQFMAIYDPILVGFGVDWWFLHSMGAGLERRVAVVDEVVCLNPHDRTKGRIREIDRLQSTADRRKVWEEISASTQSEERSRAFASSEASPDRGTKPPGRCSSTVQRGRSWDTLGSVVAAGVVASAAAPVAPGRVTWPNHPYLSIVFCTGTGSLIWFAPSSLSACRPPMSRYRSRYSWSTTGRSARSPLVNCRAG